MQIFFAIYCNDFLGSSSWLKLLLARMLFEGISHSGRKTANLSALAAVANCKVITNILNSTREKYKCQSFGVLKYFLRTMKCWQVKVNKTDTHNKYKQLIHHLSYWQQIWKYIWNNHKVKEHLYTFLFYNTIMFGTK